MVRALGILLGLCGFIGAAAAEDLEAALARTQSKLTAAMRELRALDAQLAKARRALMETEKALAAARRAHAKAEQKRRAAKQALAKARRELLWALRAAWLHRQTPPLWLGGDVSAAAHRRMLLRRLLAWERQALVRWQTAFRRAQQAEREAARTQARLAQARKRHAQALAQLTAQRRAKRAWIEKLRKKRHALAAMLRAQQQALASALLAPEERRLSQGRRLRPGMLRWPVPGRVRVRFGKPAPPLGRPADGILIAPRAELVRAAAAGRVRYAGWLGGMGLVLVLDHGHGIWTIYAHNEALLVRVGDWVEAGEAIAYAGATGWVEQETLYFGLRKHGRAIDPLAWLAPRPRTRGGRR